MPHFESALSRFRLLLVAHNPIEVDALLTLNHDVTHGFQSHLCLTTDNLVEKFGMKPMDQLKRSGTGITCHVTSE